jgi:hypothetical protein
VDALGAVDELGAFAIDRHDGASELGQVNALLIPYRGILHLMRLAPIRGPRKEETP